MTENGIVGWHHLLNGHEFDQTLEVREGQGSLAIVLQPMGFQRAKHDLETKQHNNVTKTLK